MPPQLNHLLLLILLLSFPLAHASTLKISIPADVHHNYLQLTDNKLPLEITDYSNARRSSAEALLLIQMLEAGSFKGDIELLPFSREDYARTKLRNSSSHMFSSSEWLYQIAQQPNRSQLLISSPVVRRGEYKVGIYTRPDHPGLIQPNNLSGLSATTHRLWHRDTITLNKLAIDSIHFSNNYDLMLKMVYSGRVDLMLSSFKNTKNMELNQGNIKLLPVNGVQVAMSDSRHWFFIDRNDEVSILAHMALEAGIIEFRKQGRINRAFTECGFFNERTTNWRTLNSSD